MIKPELKFYAENERLVPVFATDGAAGFDVKSKEDIVLAPFQVAKVRTGLYFEVPKGYELQVRIRSGLASKGVVLANGVGTIDSDYRGELMVLLMFTGEGVFPIGKTDRVAQGILSQLDTPTMIAVKKSDLSQTERGAGGFGSTGTK